MYTDQYRFMIHATKGWLEEPACAKVVNPSFLLLSTLLSSNAHSENKAKHPTRKNVDPSLHVGDQISVTNKITSIFRLYFGIKNKAVQRGFPKAIQVHSSTRTCMVLYLNMYRSHIQYTVLEAAQLLQYCSSTCSRQHCTLHEHALVLQYCPGSSTFVAVLILNLYMFTAVHLSIYQCCQYQHYTKNPQINT